MRDRLHGCYKDTSDSEQAAAICLGGIVALLVVSGLLALIGAIIELAK